jgi:lipoyl(octanoyl) transferase
MARVNKKVHFKQLGLIDYKDAWELQRDLFNSIIKVKLENREHPPADQIETENYLLFCEHPHVYTLGKSGNPDNLLLNEKGLRDHGASFIPIDRGGDITYHGPGQIVGYPIVDLDNFTNDIHKYLRFLEESIIITLADYGIEAGRIKGLTGVWLDHRQIENPRKICAIGVRTSRWVTMHGFAFNVNPDLSYFEHIIPCGIQDKSVTSLRKELGKPIARKEVEGRIRANMGKIFGMEFV